MKVRLTGDFATLKKWQTQLQASPEVLKAVSENLAEEAIDLIKEGFVTETDPYGARWQPKQRPDGRKTLSGKTSRLKGGWHRKRFSRQGFTVSPSVDYAAAHQDPQGGKRPQRRMYPSSKTPLPSKWRKQFVSAATEILRAHFGK